MEKEVIELLEGINNGILNTRLAIEKLRLGLIEKNIIEEVSEEEIDMDLINFNVE